MTSKEKYDEICNKINELQIEKDLMFDKLLSEDLPLKDKFNIVINSDREYDYIISYSPNGILDTLLDGDRYRRHETISLEHIACDFHTNFALPTYKEYLEVCNFLDSKITKEDYKKVFESNYSIKITLEQFYEFVDDVIKGGVSSFEFDW